MFLPQDAVAQKRSSRAIKSKSVAKHGKVKKTVIVKKVRTKPNSVKLNSSVSPALIVPYCSPENNYLTTSVYGYLLMVQYIESRDKKLWVRKFDGTMSSERSDFLNAQDYDLATRLSTLFDSADIEIHPAVRRNIGPVITTLVFKKDGGKWTVDDGKKVYQLLEDFLKPRTSTTYVPGECTSGDVAEQTQP